VRGSSAQRHIEQNLACGRRETAAAVLVNEDADLLVARPREAQIACQSRDAAVDFGDRNGVVVEPLDRCEQRRPDPWSG